MPGELLTPHQDDSPIGRRAGDVLTATSGLSHETLSLLINTIAKASVHENAALCAKTLRNILKEGADPAFVGDYLIPQAAKTLGIGWVEDTFGFVDVTIGTARLQASLRTLGEEWSGDTTLPHNAPAIIIGSAQNAQHNLGAQVLAAQLQRDGISVCVATAMDPNQFARKAESLQCDAVFLTGAADMNLDGLIATVRALRARNAHRPILLGGPILVSTPDAAALIGANLGTSDTDVALAYCGISRGLGKASLSKRGH